MKSNVNFARAQRLRTGDRIDIIAPASPFEEESLRSSLAWMASRGYEPRFSKGIFSKHGYLAGSDKRRFLEYRAAWRSKSKAIFCARGGYGSTRFLEGFEGPRPKGPKIFMGMSDLTPLLNLVAKRHKMLTIHGPVVAGEVFRRLSDDRKKFLFSFLENPDERILTVDLDYERLAVGAAEGTLWGGNLAMVCASLATPYEVKPGPSSILFLEDVSEPLYRIDRMLTQLAHSGFLKRFKGILLGDFTGPHGERYAAHQIADLVKPYVAKGTPLAFGLPSSHVRMELLLPIGGWVRMEARKVVIAPLVA